MIAEDRALQLQQDYIEAKKVADEAKAQVDSIRTEIIEASGNESFQGRLLTMKKFTRKGNIDYKTLFNFYEISETEQDAYRRASTTLFTITINPPETE